MKGKLKRILALAIGIVTCFMSITPNIAYAAEDTEGGADTTETSFLREDFAEYEKTIPNNAALNDTGFGDWVNINSADADSNRPSDIENQVLGIRQELLRGSFGLNSGTTQSVDYVTTTTKCYYGTYYTYYHQMTNRDDQTTYIYCTEPDKVHPANGTYTATRLTSLERNGSDFLELFKVALYYGYGGPGYVNFNADGSIADTGRGLYYSLNDASWEKEDGSNWAAPYSVNHLILSYIYAGCDSSGDAFKGVPDDLKAGIRTIVDSYYGWMEQSPENRAPANFEAYVFAGGDKQTITYGWLRPYGKFSIEKKSDNENLTNGNSNYSFEGAKYWVYKDATATDTWYETPLVIGEDGTSNEIWLEPGTYYLKEDQGNVLKGYKVDSTIYEITISAGTTAHTIVNTSTDVPNYTPSSTWKTVYDEPLDDPLRITIYKQDAEGNPVSDLGGTTLEGAEYTVYYFEDTSITNANVESLDLSTAKKKWTFKTIYDASTNEYTASFDALHKVSGDTMYYNADGRVVYPLGSYVISETKAPSGYTIQGSTFTEGGTTVTNNRMVVQITDNGAGDTTVSSGNTIVQKEVSIKGGVELTKNDADTYSTTPQGNATLEGAEYTIVNNTGGTVTVNGKQYANGAAIMTLTTDENGHVGTARKVLPCGAYYIYETKTPDGYQINGVHHDFTITEDNQYITIGNATDPVIRGGVKINKRDAELADPNVPQGSASLQGAVYKITNRSARAVVVNGTSYAPNTVVARLTTDEQGHAQSAANLLPYGDYEIQEETPSSGYKLNKTVIAFSIRENGVIVDLTEKDTTEEVIRGGVELVKVDAESLQPVAQADASLEGAKYAIVSENSNPVVVNGVPYLNGAIVATMETDAHGAAVTGKILPRGKYYIYETEPSEGYLLNPNKIHFEITTEGQVFHTEQQATEQVKKQAFQLIKISSNGTNTEVPVVAGAEFTMKLASEVERVGWSTARTYDVLTTDANGYAKSMELAYGKYMVRETHVPENMSAVQDFYVTITEDSRAAQAWRVFNDTPYEVYLKIVKRDAATGETILLPNVSFKIWDKDNQKYVTQKLGNKKIDTFTTDETGVTETPLKIGAGNYEIREITAPEGYLLNTQGVDIEISNMIPTQVEFDEDGDEVVVVDVYDEAVTGSVSITKHGEILEKVKRAGILDKIAAFFTRADTDNLDFTYKDAPLEECKFILVADEDIYTPDHQLDENGERRIATYDGVELSAGAVVATVTTDENGEALIEKLPLGAYHVEEVATIDGFIRNTTIDSFTLEYAGETVVVVSHDSDWENQRVTAKVELHKTGIKSGDAVEGAVYGLFNREDITLSDGTVLLPADTLIEKQTTDENGCIKFTADLPLNKYYVKELSSPAGFVPDTTEYDVDLSYVDDATPVIEARLDVADDEITLQVSKQDITTGKELPGAHLQILKEDGSIYEEWDSTTEPHIISCIPAGDYVLHEDLTPVGFATASDIHFTVEETGEVQKVVMYDEVTKVEISKQDITTGKELPGAHLQIISADGSIYAEWDSTDKPHYIEKMPTGKYVLHEDLTPIGYVTAGDIAFEVKDTGEVQKVVMKDDVTKVEISKQDITTGRELPGAHLQILKEDGSIYAEWDSTDKPHYIEKMPMGTYVLHEVSSPDGYAIASDVAFEVKDTGEIQKVVMYDERTPDVPDVPKTGDTNPIGPIAGVCAAAIVTMGAAIGSHRRKKK